MSPQPSAEATEEVPCATARSPVTADIDFGNLDPTARMLRNFSHRCRNSLSGIKLGLYLLKKQGECNAPSRCNELWRKYEEIENLFDRLQRISQISSLTVVRSPLGQLFAERLPLWRARFGEFGRSIRIDPPDQDLAGDFDPTHLGLGLDSFIAWRSQSAWRNRPVSPGALPTASLKSPGMKLAPRPQTRAPTPALAGRNPPPIRARHWPFCSWPASPTIMAVKWKPAEDSPSTSPSAGPSFMTKEPAAEPIAPTTASLDARSTARIACDRAHYARGVAQPG